MSTAWVLARSPLPLPFSRRKKMGEALRGPWLLRVRAFRLLPPFQEGVAGSSLSQESLVLADPDPVASSSSPRGDRQSRSGGRGDSTGDHSRSRSSRFSPPQGRASREERRCARSRSRGGGLVTGLERHALIPRTVRGRVDENAVAVNRHAPLLPLCGLVATSRGLLATNGTDEWPLALLTIALAIDWLS